MFFIILVFYCIIEDRYLAPHFRRHARATYQYRPASQINDRLVISTGLVLRSFLAEAGPQADRAKACLVLAFDLMPKNAQRASSDSNGVNPGRSGAGRPSKVRLRNVPG